MFHFLILIGSKSSYGDAFDVLRYLFEARNGLLE